MSKRIVIAMLALAATTATVRAAQLFRKYEAVTFLVRDGDTKKPIEGAEVEVMWLAMMDPFVPWPVKDKTKTDGRATVKVCTSSDHKVQMYARSRGYQDYEATSQTNESIRPKKNKSKDQPDHVIDLFAGPEPHIELVVPDDFRGLIKVEVRSLDEKDWKPGQRRFTVNVPKGGVVEVRGPEMLLRNRFSQAKYTARFANGQQLLERPSDEPMAARMPNNRTVPLQAPNYDPTAVALRWRTSTETDEFYVIGTQADFNDADRIVHKYLGPNTITFDIEGVAEWTKRQKEIK